MNVIFKASRLVVDRLVAAQILDALDVLGSGSSAEHSCAVRLCELHRHRPDPSGGGVDEHCLTRAQLGGVEQSLVRR